MLTSRGIPHIVLLLSEIFPAKLALMEEVDAWVQVRVFVTFFHWQPASCAARVCAVAPPPTTMPRVTRSALPRGTLQCSRN